MVRRGFPGKFELLVLSDVMNRRRCVLVLAFLLALAAPLAAQLTGAAATAKAEAILKNLQSGNTGDIVKDFDEKMSQAIPEAQLKTVWQSLVEKFGAVKTIDQRRTGQLQGIERSSSSSASNGRTWFSVWCSRTTGGLPASPFSPRISPCCRRRSNSLRRYLIHWCDANARTVRRR
jgi:hypothetical protein